MHSNNITLCNDILYHIYIIYSCITPINIHIMQWYPLSVIHTQSITSNNITLAMQWYPLSYPISILFLFIIFHALLKIVLQEEGLQRLNIRGGGLSIESIGIWNSTLWIPLYKHLSIHFEFLLQIQHLCSYKNLSALRTPLYKYLSVHFEHLT